MKKITLLLAFLITSIGFSQQEVVEDFEGSPSIAGFEGLASATIVDGPANGGTTSKTYQLVTSTGGNPWQGAEVVLGNNIVLDLTTDKTIQVDVYSTTAFGLMTKVEGTGPAAANTQAHTGSGWETLTFTFTTGSDGTATANGEYTKVVFFPNRKADDSGWGEPIVDITINIDNIKGIKKAATAPTPPTTAAPTPPARNAWDVISLYSDAYTDVGRNFDAGWCGGGSIEEIMIAGNATMAYKSNACQGIVLDAGVDASAFTKLHVDIYIADGYDVTSAVFNLKYVQQPGGAAKEYNFNVGTTPALEAGKWISIDVDIDLTGFTGFKEFGITSNMSNSVWYDNLYTYRAATASVENNELLGFSMYPNPANNVLNISAKETIKNADIFNVLGKKVMSVNINKANGSIDVSNLSSGIYLIKYNVNDKVGTAKFIKQ